jgi:type II secretory pathway component PulC
MHFVKRSFYLKDYKILLEFDDQKLKIVDLEEEIWGPVFEPLKDPDYFKKVKVKEGTIVWPNEADFCPDMLYKMGKEIKTR